MSHIEVLKYKDIEYRRFKAKWVDDKGFIVPLYLQDEINDYYASQIQTDQMGIIQLIKEADKFKSSGSYIIAIKFYYDALRRCDEICDRKTASLILPRLSSCYRLTKQPRKAIGLFTHASEIYGSSIITPVLLTTAAAAYCDLLDYEKAKKCLNRAYKQNDGKSSEEMKLIYARIKKEAGD